MIFQDEDEDRGEQEPRELPDMGHLVTAAPCVVCGKDTARTCMHCGEPVCIHPTNYMSKSTCGDWIMDWVSNGAMDSNEFWCLGCLVEEYDVDAEAWKSQAVESKLAPAPVQATVDYIEDEQPF